MGKVIPLDANRKKGSVAQTDTDVRASISKFLRAAVPALCRAIVRITAAVGRLLVLTCCSMLITMLTVIGQPLRLLTRLGAIAVLISGGLEYFDHWRHVRLFLVAGGALVFVTALVMCHEQLLEGMTGMRSRLRGNRA
ncbi:hypothetical protein SBC2_85590 (plasmid) [Caballeronia sp. SBC2]|nr:hypothetical protein SBC2_85590 [Caballeronia sp. SBC2]